MTSIEDFSKQYARKIINAPNSKAQAIAVMGDINGIVYKSNDKPLVTSDRRELLLRILKEIIEEGLVTKSFDNTSYLDLVAYLIQQLEDTKK